MLHATPAPGLDEQALPPDAVARLRVFESLLLHWSARLSLVSAGDRPALWQRHILDSLQLLTLLPDDPTPALDLGSGAGLPGLVLAIAAGIPFHLVDSDRRKCAFLREAARVTGASVVIHPSRIEAIPPFPAGLVTCRALAPLPRLLALAAPFLTPRTICLFPVGRHATLAAPEWSFDLEIHSSQTDPSSHILRLRNIVRAKL
ncbi:MAG: 16S rRNA (guanine(527)-N(7))-methyltransferase RsmG [Acetobacteraceae bacterium]